MIRIFRPPAGGLEPYWREIRRLWRQDQIRRHHMTQLEDLKRVWLLGQIDLWLVWDTEPPDRGEFGGPHFCLAIMLVHFREPHTVVLQMAAARSIRRWAADFVKVIESYATARGAKQLEVSLRKGWRHDLGSPWAMPVTLRSDPGALHVGHLLSATA